MEASARRACEFLYTELQDGDGQPACPLIRCYKTHPFGQLDAGLQRFARAQLDPQFQAAPDMKCLTLLATVGDQPAWNDRRRSLGHQAIPLATASMIEQAPMIAQLIRAFGMQLSDVVSPTDAVVRDLAGKTYGVFFVRNALNSPYIPAQDFVRRHKIQSVVGMGGSLRSGDFFAFIAFSRVQMQEESADRFRTLALDIKSVFYEFDDSRVFD